MCHIWDTLFGALGEFQICYVYTHACIWPVFDIARRGHSITVMLRNSVFTDLKISVKSLKSQGILMSSISGNPVAAGPFKQLFT